MAAFTLDQMEEVMYSLDLKQEPRVVPRHPGAEVTRFNHACCISRGIMWMTQTAPFPSPMGGVYWAT